MQSHKSLRADSTRVTKHAAIYAARSVCALAVFCSTAHGDERLPNGAARRFGATALRTGSRTWALTYNPDGRTLISGSESGEIHVWDMTAGNLLRSLQGHSGGVLALACAPDGRTVVSGGSDGTVRVWDVE